MMQPKRRSKPRVRWPLLFLLWIWAGCIFLIVDLFLDVEEFDRIRPRASLYRGMRIAAHRMVGEAAPPAHADELAGRCASLPRREVPPAPSASELRELLEEAESIDPAQLCALLEAAIRRPDPALAEVLLRLRPLVPAETRALGAYAVAVATLAAFPLRWRDAGSSPRGRPSSLIEPWKAGLVPAALEALDRHVALLGDAHGDWDWADAALQRIALAEPGFALDPRNARHVERIREAVDAAFAAQLSGPGPPSVPLVRLASLLGGRRVVESSFALLERSAPPTRAGDRDDYMRRELAVRTVLRWGSPQQRAALGDLLAATAGVRDADDPASELRLRRLAEQGAR